MAVKEVMSSEVYTARKKQSVSEVFKLMLKKDVSRIVVVEQDKPIGIVTLRDLMDRLGSSKLAGLPPSKIRISTVMTENPLIISPEAELEKAARIMLDRNVSCLPVVENNKLVGILTKTDLIRVCKDLDKVTVGSIYIKYDSKITPQTRIVHAKMEMWKNNLKLLPVQEFGSLVGLLTEKELVKAFYKIRELVESTKMDSRVRSIIVEDIMIQNPPFVKLETPVSQAVERILKSRLPGLPVVIDSKPVGVIQKRNLLELI